MHVKWAVPGAQLSALVSKKMKKIWPNAMESQLKQSNSTFLERETTLNKGIPIAMRERMWRAYG